MPIRSNPSPSKSSSNRKTTKLGIEQLESRLMNSVDSLESSLQLLSSPGLLGNTQVVSTTTLSTNTPPTVASELRLTSGVSVQSRSASLSVAGADDGGESRLKYNWSVVNGPTGGTVQFSTNKTNAAKNNTLTFNKSGTYQILVTITDSQGLSTQSALSVNVVQSLSRFVVKAADGTSLPATINTSDIRRGFSVVGLDQFGSTMAQQPSVSWSTISAPNRGTATFTTNANGVSAVFSRAGSYVLNARSGSVNSTVSVNVTQSLTYVNLASTSGTAIDPSQPLSVTSKSQAFVVRGFDQFGDSMATMPRVTFSATSAPSGGVVSASLVAGITTITFNRIGTYSIRAQSGQSSFSFNANVVPTLTSIGLRNAEGRAIATTAVPATSGKSLNFSAVGLDQFGGTLASQPTISWVARTVPTGGSASLVANGNAIAATFNQAGAYTLRAQSGSISADQLVQVNQTVTELRLLTPNGSVVNTNTPVSVAAANQRLTVQAIDQFGDVLSAIPSVSWSTVSAPTGGAARASDSTGSPTIVFTRAGTYTLKAKVGQVSQLVTLNVERVLTTIVAYTANGKPVGVGAAVLVSGLDTKLSARGLDQFGQAMPTEPSFNWTSVSAPTGTTASLVQTGNDVAVAFQKAGNYTLRATANGVSSNVTINVLQTVTRITVTPGTASVATNATQQFRYQAVDQFGQSITNPPSAVWTTTGGSIAASGLLNSGTKVGTYTVTAKVGKFVATANITVTLPVTPTPSPTPSPTPTPTPTPSGPLLNAALSSLVTSLYSDNQLTRTEMIQILKSAGTDGIVDANELADLRFISSSTSIYAMPAYVRELAKDVVNSNPANSRFKGQAAGNLVAGSSSTLLNNLVDKWFLGADEPVLTNSGYSYQTVVGNLFNGTPSRSDAKQGQLGDCYFIAALAAIADKNPDAVRNLFIDNSDGTYTVRFYVDGKADYVTVNRRLPSSSGQLRYSGYGQSISSTSTTLWIALAEKAYAQWNETGNEGRDGTNTYAGIEGGWMSYVNAQVLGYSSSNYSLAGTSKEFLQGVLATNKSVTIGTKSSSGDGLYGSHAYIITGYNAANDTFSLYNPWGYSHPGALTYAQLQANCTSFSTTDPSGSVANNLSSVRSSMSSTFVGNWTTVVLVRVESTPDESVSRDLPVAYSPIEAILNSELQLDTQEPVNAVIDTPESSPERTVQLNDDELVSPLTASLVDLAMSQLIQS